MMVDFTIEERLDHASVPVFALTGRWRKTRTGPSPWSGG